MTAQLHRQHTITRAYGAPGTFTASLADCATARHLGGGHLEIAGQRVGWTEVRDLIAAEARASGGIYVYYPVQPYPCHGFEYRIGVAPVIRPEDQQQIFTGWTTQAFPRATQLDGGLSDLWERALDQFAHALIPPDDTVYAGYGEDADDDARANARQWLG